MLCHAVGWEACRCPAPLVSALGLTCLQKNAFVLMSQHRHELAAAFFILGAH